MVTVEEFLAAHGIEFDLHNHPPVYTAEEAAKLIVGFDGMSCKNLLLKDQKGKRYFLIILPSNQKINMAEIASLVGEKKLSFANPGNLKEKLGVEAGAVSPFGLLNDKNEEVELYIKKEVLDADNLSFHPNRNTASIELTGEMFRKFLETLNRKIKTIN